MESLSPSFSALSAARPAEPAPRRRDGRLSRLSGLVDLARRATRARLQPAETMSTRLRADLGLGPTLEFERPTRTAEHERQQAAMASRFASRRS
ncbi:hypothetical protein [Jiella pacifica]|uniref:Uncharacterized protein n=1 Tax=Jiella pacifica TaxID=2696469 RepID=A0A6N9T4J9_9HYPH|nr:hypothetical protein [Jiella pacifica]NDW04739.1 hypothetical protein [Jiella pacifica]